MRRVIRLLNPIVLMGFIWYLSAHIMWLHIRPFVGDKLIPGIKDAIGGFLLWCVGVVKSASWHVVFFFTCPPIKMTLYGFVLFTCFIGLCVFVSYKLSVPISSNEIVRTTEDVLRKHGIGARIVNNSILITCGELNIPFEDDNREYAKLRGSDRIRVRLEPESGTHDILDIIGGCTVDGAEIELYLANEGDTIVIEHSDSHIQLIEGEDVVLTRVEEFVRLRRSHGKWISLEEPIGIESKNQGNLHGRANAMKLLDEKGSGVLVYTDDAGVVFENVIEEWVESNSDNVDSQEHRIYYTSPNGRRSDCSQKSPCQFVKAVEISQPGDSIILMNGGEY